MEPESKSRATKGPRFQSSLNSYSLLEAAWCESRVFCYIQAAPRRGRRHTVHSSPHPQSSLQAADSTPHSVSHGAYIIPHACKRHLNKCPKASPQGRTKKQNSPISNSHILRLQRRLGRALRLRGELVRHALELAPALVAHPRQLHLKALLLVVHLVQAAGEEGRGSG